MIAITRRQLAATLPIHKLQLTCRWREAHLSRTHSDVRLRNLGISLSASVRSVLLNLLLIVDTADSGQRAIGHVLEQGFALAVEPCQLVFLVVLQEGLKLLHNKIQGLVRRVRGSIAGCVHFSLGALEQLGAQRRQGWLDARILQQVAETARYKLLSG